MKSVFLYLLLNKAATILCFPPYERGTHEGVFTSHLSTTMRLLEAWSLLFRYPSWWQAALVWCYLSLLSTDC